MSPIPRECKRLDFSIAEVSRHSHGRSHALRDMRRLCTSGAALNAGRACICPQLSVAHMVDVDVHRQLRDIEEEQVARGATLERPRSLQVRIATAEFRASEYPVRVSVEIA